MKKIIDQYILKRFILTLLTVLLGFIIIFVIVNVIDFLDKFIDRNLTSKEILLYYVYTIPLFINIALPMSMLIATIHTIGSLQKNNEITAIKAAGISIRRIGLPIIICSIIFCFISFFFENIIVVKSIQKRFDIEKKLKPHSSKYIKNRKTDIFYHLNNSFLEIKKFNYKNDTGYNISLQEYNGSDLKYRIDAKKMTWNPNNNNWILINGSTRLWKNEIYEYKSFKRKELYIEDINPSIIKKDFVKPEEMDYWELSDLIIKFKKNGIDATRWLVNKNYKTAFACVPLIMAIFGIALSIQKPRGNNAVGIGLSIMVIFMYYALITFGKTLGYNGILPPFLSVWFINFCFLMFGTITLLKAKT